MRDALRRGPLVYCLEEADNPGGPVQRIALPRAGDLGSEPRDDLFGGTVVVTADALRAEDGDWNGALYRTDPPKRAPSPRWWLPIPQPEPIWCRRSRRSRRPRGG